MQWLRDPQRDSRENIRAAQQALVYAGYPHGDAVTEVTTHLHRVRAALAAPRHALVAGFLTGASMAVGVLLVLAVAIDWIQRVIIAATPLSPDFALPAGTGPTAAQAAARLGASVGVPPSFAAATLALGLAGAGMAHARRSRWRSAGVLQTFTRLRPRRRDWLADALLWLGVGAVFLLFVWALAPLRLGVYVSQALAFLAVPLGTAAFSGGFSRLFTWSLPRVSPVDAAAYVRPIIEREAARQVLVEQHFLGRHTYDRSSYDRIRWAQEFSAAERQGGSAVASRSESAWHRSDEPLATDDLRRVLKALRPGRYILLTGVITAGAWQLARWLSWISHPAYHLGDKAADSNAGVVGILVGLVLGVAVSWLYANVFEDL